MTTRQNLAVSTLTLNMLPVTPIVNLVPAPRAVTTVILTTATTNSGKKLVTVSRSLTTSHAHPSSSIRLMARFHLPVTRARALPATPTAPRPMTVLRADRCPSAV